MEPKEEKLLSDMEIDAIGEILNISLGSSATSVSELLGQRVDITTPEVKLLKTSEFNIQTYEPAVGVEIQYVEGLSGKNILILKKSDVKIIVGLLLQTDFSDKEFVLDEMNIGAICEVMNQMMGASATALSQFLNRTINISPPNSFAIEDSDQFKKDYIGNEEDVVAVYFNLMIGSLINSQFINVMPIPLAKELVSRFGLNPSQDPNSGVLPEVSAAPVPAPEDGAEAAAVPPAGPAEPRSASSPAPAAAAQGTAPSQKFSLSGAAFPSFDEPEPSLTRSESNNLNMILSVPLQVTVEIGRTSKKIKDILQFSAGTIVELDKQAGSQVDVYVNGQAVAKGNVVVVDDLYGVRITEVMNSDEIMKLI